MLEKDMETALKQWGELICRQVWRVVKKMLLL